MFKIIKKDTYQSLIQETEAAKANIIKLQNALTVLQKDNDFFYDLITDDNLNAYDLKIKIARMNLLSCLQDILTVKQGNEINNLNEAISNKKSEIVILDDEILYQTVGLYTPLYNACSSDDYKEMINTCRAEQKHMVKSGTAAICDETWAVNQSYARGVHFTKQSIKHIIRSFNIECEYLISKVKYHNIVSIQKRIEKSYNDLNSLNDVSQIHLTPEYLALKLKELRLCYEFEQSKQYEKERARVLREERREQAKVQKEIQEQRAKIKKEQAHYHNHVEQLKMQLQTATDMLQVQELRRQLNRAMDTLRDLDKSLSDIDYREANEKAGYVYIISNIGAFGENVYKIGMTRRLNPQDRINELSDASVPFKFDVHAMIFSENAPALEAALHRSFVDKRINMTSNRKEFFNVSLEEIKKVVRENYDKSVDFVNIPPAQQYRESIQIRKQIRKQGSDQ